MTIFGREVHFFFSVGAKYRIDSIGTEDAFMRAVKTAVIASEAYEERKAIQDPEYKKTALTEREVMQLDDDQFAELMDELAACFTEGKKQSVETASKKKQAKGSS